MPAVVFYIALHTFMTLINAVSTDGGEKKPLVKVYEAGKMERHPAGGA